MSQDAPIAVQDAIAWLEQQRLTQERNPYDIVRFGEWLLEHNYLSKLGSDVWAFLEQLGMAAAELGNQDLAELCLSRLQSRFMDSTRVALLKGVIEESHGRLDEAQSLYEKLLEKEPSNLLVNKRRLACIKTKPEGVTRATEGLAELVDIYPTDHECWLELASLYLSQNKYSQAAYALEELVLLAPHNVFYILKYAETLYTTGDIAKAYKMFLRILELGDGNLAPSSERTVDRVQGPWVRALWGLKMCTAKLLGNKALSMSQEGDIKAEHLEAVDALATKLLLDSVYAPNATFATPQSSRSAARTVLTPSSSS